MQAHDQAGAGAAAAQTLSYGYDRLSRLTSAGPQGSPPTAYDYDPAGNRLTKTPNGTPTAYTYDRADRLTSAGGTAYTLNANGNTVARGADTFTYDQANRLTSATIGGVTTTYTYDGDGQRASSTVGGVTTRYVYDVGGGLPVLLDDGTRKYVWGGNGLAYAVERTGNGTATTYHTDGLGSVRALTDASGAVVQTYETDEFGVPLAAGTQGTKTQPFGFTGEQRDAESGFSYLRARMYDPQVGRFLQRDPSSGFVANPLSLNRYSYVENNPAILVDPSGLNPGQATANVLRSAAPARDPAEAFTAAAPQVPCVSGQLGGVLCPQALQWPATGPQQQQQARAFRMRVQPQQGPNSIASFELDGVDPAHGVGVTVGQVWTALEAVSAALPNRARRDLHVQAAFWRAKMWAATRPPMGVTGSRNVHRSLFSYGGLTYRIDIEHIAGDNLRTY